VQLVVSMNKAKMLEGARGGSKNNIAELIKHVPSVTILSGDPAFAVRVEVEERHVAMLRSSVADLCTVGPYREYTVLS
jgi:hypothetical protein